MQVEEAVRVSSNGQIVLPKRVRQKFSIEPGKTLHVASDEGSILLRKLEDLSLEEISDRTHRVVKAERIDVPTLIEEAISWARRKKRRSK